MRRVVELVKILLDNNCCVIISSLAPTESIRNIVRLNIINVIEVWCFSSLTIINNNYEKPLNHLIELNLDKINLIDCLYIIKT